MAAVTDSLKGVWVPLKARLGSNSWGKNKFKVRQEPEEKQGRTCPGQRLTGETGLMGYVMGVKQVE